MQGGREVYVAVKIIHRLAQNRGVKQFFGVSVEEGIENLFLSHSPKQGRGGGGVGVGGPLVRVLNFPNLV